MIGSIIIGVSMGEMWSCACLLYTSNGDILYFVHLPNAAVNLHQTIHYAIFCNVNHAGVQKNVIGINELADLSFLMTNTNTCLLYTSRCV